MVPSIKIRHGAAMAAGVLAGAFTFVTPASAHVGALTGSSACTEAGWKAVWKLTTSGTDGAVGVISDVDGRLTYGFPLPPPPDSGTPPKPAVSTAFVDGGKVTGDGVFSDEHTFFQAVHIVSLSFTVTWTGVDGATHADQVRADATSPSDCKDETPTGPSNLPPALPDDDATPPAQLPDPGDDDGGNGTTAPEDLPPAKPIPEHTRTATTAPEESPAPVLADDTGGSDLPLTGAAVAAIAGGAGVLLAVGAVLLALSRRRKMRFTA